MKVACIPAYNEEDVISKIINDVSKYVDKVIVCDDGSTDDTFLNAKKSGAYVIKHLTNKGKGAAMKSLFNEAKNISADIIITLDGDGQFLPEEIPKLVKKLVQNNADIVIGYRLDKNENKIPTYRRAGNKILDKITNLASELPFRDTQSGFRAYSKKAIDIIEFSSDGFTADSEILINASEKKLMILEEKITVLYNTGRKTSTKGAMSHFSELIGGLIRIIAIRHPLRYLGIPGFILLILGISYSGIVISIFNETRYFSIPSTFVALGSLMIGVVLLLMAVVLYSISNLERNK